MIRLESVCKTYRGDFGGETVALDQVSIDLVQGEYNILIGVNGCGKSSLLQVIAGSIIPDSGRVYLNELDVTNMPEHRRSHSLARLFQNPMMGTAPALSILENFRLAALRSKSKGLRIGIDKLFRERVAHQISRLGMGLENRLDLPISALSGGQRQALTLLMGTMDECSIILMDEPASALDPRSAELIMNVADEIIRERNLTALLVTHQLEDCLRYGDRVIQMNHGRIIREVSGETKKNLDTDTLRSWFAKS